MRLLSLKGSRPIYKNVSSCLIDWDGKSRSKIQFEVKQFFKKYWLACVVYEEFPVFGSRMKVDIVNATRKIAVEVNGQQHGKFNKFFHNDSRAKYLDGIKRDFAKSKWLEKNGFRLIEIEYNEIDKLSEKFIQEKYNITL